MSIAFPDDYLREVWNSTDWAAAEATLASLQAQLSIAAYKRDMAEITRIQKKIVRNTGIKCLAVRHVVQSSGGPGVDGVRWRKPEEMMRAAFSLNSKDYHAQPFRQVLIIAKNTGKQRRPAIPTYHDRAMMVLYGYSFIPVSEAWADRKSFAFRQGRSTQDAQAYIFEALKGENAPEYVVCADIRTFYATIQHSWLLKNVPMDKRVLSEFLNAGLVFAGELFPSEGYGISEGSNISPYLGNFVLDGLQEYIYRGLYGNEQPDDYANGNLIRFADDVFVTARSRETAEKVLTLIRGFLDERGLKLSPEKTKIPIPTQSSMGIAQKARDLFNANYRWDKRVRAVCVRAINLVPKDTPQQLDIYTDAEKLDKREKLEDTIEDIRRRFGKRAIFNACLFGNLKMPSDGREQVRMPGMMFQ